MKILSDIQIFKKYLGIFELELDNEKGDVFTREYVNVIPSVAVVVYNTIKNKYIFVKQFRQGGKDYLLELVAGHIDNENEVETVRREVTEETGYVVDCLSLLVPAYLTSPGFSNETITIYFAEVSEKISDGGGLVDEHEDIEIVEFDEHEIAKYNWKDGKTLIALLKVGLL